MRTLGNPRPAIRSPREWYPPPPLVEHWIDQGESACLTQIARLVAELRERRKRHHDAALMADPVASVREADWLAHQSRWLAVVRSALKRIRAVNERAYQARLVAEAL